MTAPWFRVDASYLSDGRLVRAGWQAGLLWVPLLSLLKQREGVLQDADLDPAVLTRLTGAPFEVVAAGLEALCKQGLLLRGARTLPGGPGGRREVEGWVVESWDRYQPDGRLPWAERRAQRDASRETPPLPREAPPQPDGSAGASRETRKTGHDSTRRDDLLGAAGAAGASPPTSTAPAEMQPLPLPPNRALQVTPATEAERLLLAALARWSQAGVVDARRWAVNPAEDLAWFRVEIVDRFSGADSRLASELQRWSTWLENEYRGVVAGNRATKFPKVWKNALRNWLRIAGDRPHAAHQPRGAFAGSSTRFPAPAAVAGDPAAFAEFDD